MACPAFRDGEPQALLELHLTGSRRTGAATLARELVPEIPGCRIGRPVPGAYQRATTAWGASPPSGCDSEELTLVPNQGLARTSTDHISFKPASACRAAARKPVGTAGHQRP